MKLPKRKNVDWAWRRNAYRIEERIKRWYARFHHRLLIKYFIDEVEGDVVKSISLGRKYIDKVYLYQRYILVAYRLIAMRYGLNFEIIEWGGDESNIYNVVLSIKK